MSPTASRLGNLGTAAAVGLLSAGVTVATGELVAAMVRPPAAPVIAVGNRLIQLTPEPVKRWAIRQFGTSDKHVLLTGIYLGIALAAVLIGVLALRRLAAGLTGVVLLGALGSYCAWTVPGHQGGDAVPSILGALAGVATLRWLVLNRPPPETAAPNSPAATSAAPATPTSPATGPARRRFLRGGLAAGGFAVLGSLAGRALQHDRFNAAAARAAITLPEPASAPSAAGAATLHSYDLGKSGVPFSTPASDFYRIDTALSVPQVDPKTWTLRLHGMVDRELTLNYQQLLARPLVERWVTLACVSNEVGGRLISNALFRGVLLADLLREAGLDPAADQLLATSVDAMTIGSPIAVLLDGRDAMLAVGMNGQPLPIEHGFPVRMVVPGLYGYVSACKWLADLEVTTFAREQAYWVRGGWAERGPIKLASRIDRPSNSEKVSLGSQVAVAGIAWDQHVGVSRVQVQVDSEPWQDAVLAPVPSTDTWRQWVYLWTPGAAGRHQLRVRAFDANGQPQQAKPADPFPSGATGLHTVTVTAG